MSFPQRTAAELGSTAGRSARTPLTPQAGRAGTYPSGRLIATADQFLRHDPSETSTAVSVVILNTVDRIVAEQIS
ncbi:hypothetical protein CH266_17240 [Rhodococcus sp. 06-1474-1B]|nr:hypothetical protein CH266_17240 [Rhodococcus sp. 06-1474-1B]